MSIWINFGINMLFMVRNIMFFLFFVVITGCTVNLSEYDAIENAKKIESEKFFERNLMVFYNFNEKSCKDAVGNYDGILCNNPDFIADSPKGDGHSILLTSENKGYIMFGKEFLNLFSDSFTISFWIKNIPDNMSVFTARVELDDNLYNSRNIVSIFNYNLYYSEVGYGKEFDMDLSEIRDNKWHMITLSMKNNNLSVYTDGNFISSKYKYNYNNFKDKKYFCIGGIGEIKNSEYLAVKLDNIRIYNCALSPVLVSQLYKHESGN